MLLLILQTFTSTLNKKVNKFRSSLSQHFFECLIKECKSENSDHMQTQRWADREQPSGLPLWRNKRQAWARCWWQITRAGMQEAEERKEEGDRRTRPPVSLNPGPLWALGGSWRGESRGGGRVVMAAYCLSCVRCSSRLSAHSSRSGYLYPHNIHADRSRLQPFSSSNTLDQRVCLLRGFPFSDSSFYRISPFINEQIFFPEL